MDDKFLEQTPSFGILNQAPVAICIVSGDNYVVDLANDQMLQFLGRTKEMIGQPLIQSLTEADTQGLIKILDQVRITGESFHTSNFPAVILINGLRENKYFDLVIKRDEFYNIGTDNTRIYCVAHDITYQVLALQELEEVTGHLNFRSALFEAQNEATPDGVLIVDAKGKMLLYNHRFSEIWNMPQHIIDQKDDEAALKHGMTLLVDPDAFIERVKFLYKSKTENSYDQIAFKDGRIIERNGIAIIAENGLYYGWAWYFRDITVRVNYEKQLEQKVAERTAELEREIGFTNSILDASINGVIVLDAVRNNQDEIIDFTIIKINKAFIKMIGLDDSIIGKSYLNHFPGSTKTGTLHAYKHVLSSGEPVRKEVYSEDLNLNSWFDISVNKRGDNGLVITFTNISAERKASIAVERQKNLLDSIMKNSPMGITVYKAIRNNKGVLEDLQCILANDKAEQLTQSSNDDRLNKTVLQLNPDVRNTPLFDMIADSLNESKPFQTQYYQTTINKWLEMSVAKIDDDHLVNVFSDITNSKEAQLKVQTAVERLEAVFNAAQSGMFTFTPVVNEVNEIVDFKFVITNNNFAAYVGQTPEILNGAPGSTWFPGYLTNGVFEMYKKTYLTGETQRVNIHYNVDQHDIFLDLMSTKVGDEILVTFNDYTPLKKAQIELENSLDELKRSNENLQEFAYAASHDLKEPVRKILFFGDVLQQAVSEKLSDTEKRYFERMGTAARRMNSLIDNLLIYSKVSFKPDISEEVDLNEVMKEVLEDLDLEIEQKKVKIKVDNLVKVHGHQRQLQQAFQNLIANAIKYIKPDVNPEVTVKAIKVTGNEITLPIHAEDINKRFYKISVKDNGIGFEQKEADNIFNVFTRLHTSDKYQGTGVGLSIVRKVILNHKGYISAESKPGEGAIFNVFIPVNK